MENTPGSHAPKESTLKDPVDRDGNGERLIQESLSRNHDELHENTNESCIIAHQPQGVQGKNASTGVYEFCFNYRNCLHKYN